MEQRRERSLLECLVEFLNETWEVRGGTDTVEEESGKVLGAGLGEGEAGAPYQKVP